MVQLSSSSFNDSPGLLGTPNCSPKQGLSPESYVGRSFFPLPIQCVVLLEGCSLNDVTSWDLAVSSKEVKLKIIWSCNQQSNSGCLLSEKFPSNILKAISSYDLARPSWSSSSSPNKLSLNINWQILSTNFSTLSLLSPKRNKDQHNVTFITPDCGNYRKNFDSGYQSFKAENGCYGSSSSNWRQNISPPKKPNLSSSNRKKSKNDTFRSSLKPPVSKPGDSSNESTSKVTSQDASLNIPKSPSQPTADNNVSSYNKSESESESIASSLAAPDDFPKSFLPIPNPLPIDDSGLLNPDLEAQYMNIPGTCRLCNETVESYLVNLHLLECEKRNYNKIDDFIEDVASKTFICPEDIVSSSKEFLSYELPDFKIPNKVFSNVDKYHYFSNKLESLTFELAEDILKELDIPSEFTFINILKY